MESILPANETFVFIDFSLEDVYDVTVEKIKNFIEAIKVFTTSPHFDIGTLAFAVVTKFAKVIHFTYVEIVKLFKSQGMSSQLKSLLNTALQGIKSLVEITKNTLTSIEIIQVLLLPLRLYSYVVERVNANASGDEKQIRRINFEVIELIVEFFRSPDAILDFLVLCEVAIEELALTIASGIASAFCALLAIAQVIRSFSKHDATSKFLDELKKERHQVFLTHYYNKLLTISDEKEKIDIFAKLDGIENLSLAESTLFKKEITLENAKLADFDKAVTKREIFKESLKIANKHFIEFLNEKIKVDRHLVEEHFRVKVPHANNQEIELSTRNDKGKWESQGTYFEKLSLLEDEMKMGKAVQYIKTRLLDKLIADKSTMMLGSSSLVPTVMGMVVTCGICPLMIPVVATLAAINLTAKIATIVEETFYRKPEFIAAMEHITGGATPEAHDLEFDNETTSKANQDFRDFNWSKTSNSIREQYRNQAEILELSDWPTKI